MRMPSLKSYALKQAEGGPQRLGDIEGQAVTITSVEFRDGDFGHYALMMVVLDSGEHVEVMTGAALVVDALENAEEVKAFPLRAMFVRKGRSWLVDDVAQEELPI